MVYLSELAVNSWAECNNRNFRKSRVGTELSQESDAILNGSTPRINLPIEEARKGFIIILIFIASGFNCEFFSSHNLIVVIYGISELYLI